MRNAKVLVDCITHVVLHGSEAITDVSWQGRDLRYDDVGATCWGFSDLCHHSDIQIEGRKKKEWRKNE